MLDSVDILISFVLIMLIVSLLITVAVQAVSSALNLRGWNLEIGLIKTIEVACPNLDKDWKPLVRHILTSPILSDSSFLTRVATAARPHEIFDALRRIASSGQPAGADGKPPTPGVQARNLMLALGVSPETIEIASQDAHQASETARTLEGQAEAAISSMPPEVQAKVRGVIKGYSDQLDAYAQHIASRAATDAATAASEIDQAYQRFEYWYNIGQERAQAWFTGHARLITVLWAVVFTLLLQLDTIEIFRLVSTNKTVRDKLVAEVSAVTDQAQRSIGANQTVLQDAVIDLAGQEPDPIKTRLLNFKVDPAATRDQVREQVRQLVFGATGSGDFADFDAAVDKEAGEHLEDTVHDYQTLRTSLDTTGFDLFPVGRWRWGPFWWSGFSLHWLGMLFSVALLSLGAPFWFNALKSLTNLRSAVAENIDAEQDGDGSSNSPPTPGKPAGQQPG